MLKHTSILKVSLFVLFSVFAQNSWAAFTEVALNGTPVSNIEISKTYLFVPNIANNTGSRTKYYVFGKPSWATFNYQNGAIFGTPRKASDVGLHEQIFIMAVVGDTYGVIGPFTIEVTDASLDLNPKVTADNASTKENTAVTIQVLKNDSSQGNLPSQVLVGANPANGTVKVNSDGSIQYTPKTNFVGKDTFTYKVKDNDGDQALAAVTISVNCVASCKSEVQLSWDAPTTNTDGSNLTDLAGYLVNYGTAPGVYQNSVDVVGATVTNHKITATTNKMLYISISAYDRDGNTSDESVELAYLVP